MNLVRAHEGNAYDAVGHFGGIFIAKQSENIPGNDHLSVSLSHFQPGGGCEYKEISKEWGRILCYYVVKGQITVTTKNEEKFTMYEGDSVLWIPGDARGFVNEGETETDLLVIIAH